MNNSTILLGLLSFSAIGCGDSVGDASEVVAVGGMFPSAGGSSSVAGSGGSSAAASGGSAMGGSAVSGIGGSATAGSGGSAEDGSAGSDTGGSASSDTGGSAAGGSDAQTAGGSATGGEDAQGGAGNDGACVQPPELMGWATENGGVTGGCGGPEVTVSSKDELGKEAAGADKKIIKISGTLSGSGMMDIGSNKTIIGEPGALITGFGININTQKNIIIRNISFTKANDDSLNIQNESTNIWIDHCTFASGSDGLLDIKRGSDFITVSYNHFSKHHKTCLLGHNDGNGAQDIGHLRVSYHHNFFAGSDTRNPRVRFGHAHVFNNYYKGVGGYGVAGVKDSQVLVEGNYFEDTKSPTLTKYGNSSSGNVVERMNVFKNSGSPQTGGTVAEFPYKYELDNAEDIPAKVSASAGAGKM